MAKITHDDITKDDPNAVPGSEHRLDKWRRPQGSAPRSEHEESEEHDMKGDYKDNTESHSVEKTFMNNYSRIRDGGLYKIVEHVQHVYGMNAYVNNNYVCMPMSNNTRQICRELLREGVCLIYADIDSHNVYFDAWADNHIIG